MGASSETHFVDNLIEKTISKSITWNYLLWSPSDKQDSKDSDNPRVDNPELDKILDAQEMYDKNKQELIYDRTFWTKTKTGYIYYITMVIANRTCPPILYVQRDKKSTINKVVLMADMSDLYHLENVIVYSVENSNFEEASKFIDDFLQEK